MEQTARLPLFPMGAQVNSAGHLVVGGCDTTELAEQFGTPLYVYDEATLRRNCQDVKGDFAKRYPNSQVIYACKAVILKALATIIQEEGLGLDVVSGGELGIAHAAGFPMANVYFHGNNKSAEELRMALELGVGRIVVDNFHELAMLGKMAGERGKKVDILLRVTPNVDPHTHVYTSTGSLDSKFGLPLDRAEEAVKAALAAPALNLAGLHFHIGSLIYEVDPYLGALEHVLDLAAETDEQASLQSQRAEHGRWACRPVYARQTGAGDPVLRRPDHGHAEGPLRPAAAAAAEADYRAGTVHRRPCRCGHLHGWLNERDTGGADVRRD